MMHGVWRDSHERQDRQHRPSTKRLGDGRKDERSDSLISHRTREFPRQTGFTRVTAEGRAKKLGLTSMTK